MVKKWDELNEDDLVRVFQANGQAELHKVYTGLRSSMLTLGYTKVVEEMDGEPDPDSATPVNLPGERTQWVRMGFHMTGEHRQRVVDHASASDPLLRELLETERWKGRNDVPANLTRRKWTAIKKIFSDLDPGSIAKPSSFSLDGEDFCADGHEEAELAGRELDCVDCELWKEEILSAWRQRQREENAKYRALLEERRQAGKTRSRKCGVQKKKEKKKISKERRKRTISEEVVDDSDDECLGSGQQACQGCRRCGKAKAGPSRSGKQPSSKQHKAESAASMLVASSGLNTIGDRCEQFDSDHCPTAEPMELSPDKISWPNQHGAIADAQLPQALCAETQAARLIYENRTSNLTAGEHYANLAPRLDSGILDVAEEFAANDISTRSSTSSCVPIWQV